MFQLCAPAFIYLSISLLDIIFNAYVRLYNNLLIKTIVVLSVTLFLNILCEKGFSEISWLIVLLAFLCIVVILLNNSGCPAVYYTPTNRVYIANTAPEPITNTAPAPITNTAPAPIANTAPAPKSVPVANAAPTAHNYEHIPYGTSDPAYQS
jgi:hypothetical protein